MRFRYNHLTYEVPEGIDIVVEVDDEHADFNFVKDGEIVPVLGGTDERGRTIPSWNDVGIIELHKKERQTKP